MIAEITRRVFEMRRISVIASVGAAVLAGCGTHHAIETGVVVGGIVYDGRVPDGISGASGGEYQAGLVEVMSGGRRVAWVRLRARRQFHFSVRAGRYTLRLEVPHGEAGCPTMVSVTAGSSVRADVVCVFHGLATSQNAGKDRSFRSRDLSFRYPSDWQARRYSVFSTMSRNIVYLSSQVMHPPCVTRHRTHVTTISCQQPVKRLGAHSIVAWWSENGNPDWRFKQAQGTRLVVGGRHAKLTITPGNCGINAAAVMEVDVQIPHVSDNYYGLTACLRGPGIATLEQEVRALLATVRFADR